MAQKLVTLEERNWIKENAVKMMGKIVQYKVIDIDKAVERIRDQRKARSMSPWIEIQPISEDMHKTPNRLATFQKDPVTGVYYGIALDQDDFGNIKWQKIQIHDHISLNLDRTDDAKIWAILRFHPDIEGSPWQVQNPYYKIYDPVAIAVAEELEIDAMKRAFVRIDKILTDAKKMVFFARYLGEELVENSNFALVKGALLRSAKNSPVEFNRKWDNRLRGVGEHFESARALGIISSDIDRGYMYKNISLGISPEESIKYLSQDPNILNALSNEIAEKDVVISSINEEIKIGLEEAEKVHETVSSGNSKGDFD